MEFTVISASEWGVTVSVQTARMEPRERELLGILNQHLRVAASNLPTNLQGSMKESDPGEVVLSLPQLPDIFLYLPELADIR